MPICLPAPLLPLYGNETGDSVTLGTVGTICAALYTVDRGRRGLRPLRYMEKHRVYTTGYKYRGNAYGRLKERPSLIAGNQG